MAIRGILFDAEGVFYARKESTAQYALRLLRERGYFAQLSAQDEARRKAMHHRANEGHISAEDYWSEWLQMHGVTSPKERAALIQRILEHTNRVFALPGAHSTMAALKQRGFILGIVTDTIYPLEWKMNWLAQVGVAEFVDVVACSTVLGAHKPDPVMYLDALQQAHLTPSESAFVGHDTQELDGARQAGIVTVAVNYDPAAQADYYARSLVDLLDVPIFKELHT
jgi:HAD superfamily hydrolase (TIGR01509 family)